MASPSPPAGDPPEATRYEVDAAGRISRVGGGWDAFARDNGAANLAAGAVVGRRLGDFITEPATRALYDSLLLRVRAGRRLTVPFRCDGPAVRRFMELAMEPGPEGSVRFEALLLSAEPRAPVALLDAAAPRSPEFLKVCAWCRMVEVAEEWREVEEAVEALGLFDARALPAITHGICPRCRAAVMAGATSGPGRGT